jgi:hypothetical protein
MPKSNLYWALWGAAQAVFCFVYASYINRWPQIMWVTLGCINVFCAGAHIVIGVLSDSDNRSPPNEKEDDYDEQTDSDRR